MDKTEMKEMHAKLEGMEKELQRTIDTMKKNGTGEQSELTDSELSNYDNHPADLGTEVYMAGMNKALKVHEEKLLHEVMEAMERIDKGTYGKCEFCGNEIGRDRLEALPYAKLCIECADERALNPYEMQNDRPNEELVLDAPLGRKYLNKREDDEFEGLDYLNDLEKYGSSDTPQDLGGYHDYRGFYKNSTDRQGVVDDMDQYSNEDYERQLPD